MEAGFLRIGALSKRVDVSPELLRAWEQRYGLLRPTRSGGGFRLYSPADEARVRAMRRYLDDGVSAAQAARLALRDVEAGERGEAGALDVGGLAVELSQALDRLDEPAANANLDRLLATFTTQTVLRDVLVPYLRELGERWKRGEVSVGQEHFASHVLRGRLLGLARGWGRGSGPRAVLACAPGELHDLGLLMFGIALASCGWKITYLGPDTPVATIADGFAGEPPKLVVVSATATRRLRAVEPELRELGGTVRLALAGAGATTAIAEAVGALLLDADPVTAAERVADVAV